MQQNKVNLADPLFPERAISCKLAREILRVNITEQIDMPTCFIGPPGIGKTDVVEEVAKEIKANLCVIPLSCYDASELKGIPRVMQLQELRERHPDRVKEHGTGYVTYYAHNFEFPATDDPDTWVFFFDEFNTVPPSVQVPIFQATQKRCITASYRFPEKNRIVLAGNRTKDSSAVQEIPMPIISRVNMHEITFRTNDWLSWGDSFLHPGIKSFIRENPDKLCFFTKEMVEAHQPYATPRTWVYANTLLKAYPDEKLANMEPKDALWTRLLHHLAGSVGYETVTDLDVNNRSLLHYLKDGAIDLIGADRPVEGRMMQWVQTFEADPKKPQLMMILQALPGIGPVQAALFLKRVQSRDADLFRDVVGKHPGLVKDISKLPGLKETLAQLK